MFGSDWTPEYNKRSRQELPDSMTSVFGNDGALLFTFRVLGSRHQLRGADSGVAITRVIKEGSLFEMKHRGIAGHLAIPAGRTDIEYRIRQPLEVNSILTFGIVDTVLLTILGAAVPHSKMTVEKFHKWLGRCRTRHAYKRRDIEQGSCWMRPKRVPAIFGNRQSYGDSVPVTTGIRNSRI